MKFFIMAFVVIIFVLLAIGIIYLSVYFKRGIRKYRQNQISKDGLNNVLKEVH